MKPGPKRSWILTPDSKKSCNRCGEIKAIDQFSPERRGVFGVSARCRVCRIQIKRDTYKRDRKIILLRAAAYRAANPEKVRQSKRAAMAKKPDYYRDISSTWKKNNSDRVNANERIRRVRRGDELKPLNRAKQKRFYEKRKLDPAYRLSRAFSSGINVVLRNHKNGRSWEGLVPYSVNDLRAHLERQFLSGMNWDNYGTHWHVDHIIPKSKFAFKTAECEGFAACWALTNLRPLWKHDNMVKQARRTLLI